MGQKIIVGILVALAWPQAVIGATLQDAVNNLNQAGVVSGVNEVGTLGSVVGTAINIALSLVGIIFLVLMVYAGYLWMTARGDDEQVGKARKIIVNSLIGIVIVVSAYAITFLVTSRFEG